MINVKIHPALKKLLTKNYTCPSCKGHTDLQDIDFNPSPTYQHYEFFCVNCNINIIIDKYTSMIVYKDYQVYVDFISNCTDIYDNDVDASPSTSVNLVPSNFEKSSIPNFIVLAKTFQ